MASWILYKYMTNNKFFLLFFLVAWKIGMMEYTQICTCWKRANSFKQTNQLYHAKRRDHQNFELIFCNVFFLVVVWWFKQQRKLQMYINISVWFGARRFATIVNKCFFDTSAKKFTEFSVIQMESSVRVYVRYQYATI